MGTTTTGLHLADAVKQIYLALDTSGTRTALALINEDKVLYQNTHTTPYGHNEKLLDLIKTAFNQTGLTLKDITAICLAIGPGMFTSLRVGLSVAKGLALTGKLHLKGVNTLHAIAVTAGADIQPVLALMNARREELYAALYYQGNTLITPTVTKPEKLPALISQTDLPETPLRIAGDGATIARPLLYQSGRLLELTGLIHPAPVVIAKIARKLLTTEGPDDLLTLEPLYLRRTDAELKRQLGA
ncbi:MAG: tRNA (adenosine(37)-N6)-threonylcarbamoyltransferase complex dimerization subunit type 1 TsaB [bacterium]